MGVQGQLLSNRGAKTLKSEAEIYSMIHLWRMKCEKLRHAKEIPYKRDEKKFKVALAKKESYERTWNYLMEKIRKGEKVDREYLIHQMETMNQHTSDILYGNWDYNDRKELI